MNSLYLKYRPQIFEDVYGQENIKKILINSIKENRINHAYLFFGIRGTGKTTLARIFAKSINCLNLENFEPCNKCESCMTVASSSSLDVIEIDAASNNGVDEIRDIIEKANYFSTTSKYKVYIIDEIHMLSKSAFNALLKTLEEPPKGTIFLLATTEISKIPETILSRSLILNLEILSNENIKNALIDILDKEKINYDKNALEYLVMVSSGSLRDAISNLETVLLFSKNITNENVIKALGLIDYEEVKILLSTDVNKLINLIKEKNIDPKKVIYVLIDIVTDLVKNGNKEYKKLMSNLLNLLISIKDPSLIRLSLVSMLVEFNDNISDVSRETKKEQVDTSIKKNELSEEDKELLDKKTSEVSFADELIKRNKLKKEKEISEIHNEELTSENKEIEKNNELFKKQKENIEIETINWNEKTREIEILKNSNKEKKEELDSINSTNWNEKTNETSLEDGSLITDKKEKKEDPIIDWNEKTSEFNIKDHQQNKNKEKKEELDSINSTNWNEKTNETSLEDGSLITDKKEKMVDITKLINSKHYVTVLMESNLDLLDRLKERWNFITQYSNKNNLQRFIFLLEDTKLLAANKEAIIIGFESAKNYNEFKKISLDLNLLSFINEIIGFNAFVLPILPDEWNKLRKLHSQLLLEKRTIKEKINISLPNKKNTKKEELKKLFGDKIRFE